MALSESQERMSVVVEPQDVDSLITLAHQENIEATIIAKVTQKRHALRYKGKKIVDISRPFINTNGVRQKTDVDIAKVTNNQYTF
ncbi:MAG: AIR synthase-related protein [Chitinophagaceae bacterium]